MVDKLVEMWIKNSIKIGYFGVFILQLVSKKTTHTRCGKSKEKARF